MDSPTVSSAQSATSPTSSITTSPTPSITTEQQMDMNDLSSEAWARVHDIVQRQRRVIAAKDKAIERLESALHICEREKQQIAASRNAVTAASTTTANKLRKELGHQARRILGQRKHKPKDDERGTAAKSTTHAAAASSTTTHASSSSSSSTQHAAASSPSTTTTHAAASSYSSVTTTTTTLALGKEMETRLLRAAVEKDVAGFLSRVKCGGKMGWENLVAFDTDEYRHPPAGPRTLSRAAEDNLCRASGLNATYLRPRLKAVFAGPNAPDVLSRNGRNAEAHTFTAADLALYLDMQQRGVVKLMDQDVWELIVDLYPLVFGVTRDADEATLRKIRRSDGTMACEAWSKDDHDGPAKKRHRPSYDDRAPLAPSYRHYAAYSYPPQPEWYPNWYPDWHHRYH